jgi:hypothetical protein
MSTDMPHEIMFHPLFRIRLLQMIRHGETCDAITLAGREYRRAREDYESEGGGENSDGLIMVPSPRRSVELGYESEAKRPGGLKP